MQIGTATHTSVTNAAAELRKNIMTDNELPYNASMSSDAEQLTTKLSGVIVHNLTSDYRGFTTQLDSMGHGEYDWLYPRLFRIVTELVCLYLPYEADKDNMVMDDILVNILANEITKATHDEALDLNGVTIDDLTVSVWKAIYGLVLNVRPIPTIKILHLPLKWIWCSTRTVLHIGVIDDTSPTSK